MNNENNELKCSGCNPAEGFCKDCREAEAAPTIREPRTVAAAAPTIDTPEFRQFLKQLGASTTADTSHVFDQFIAHIDAAIAAARQQGEEEIAHPTPYAYDFGGTKFYEADEINAIIADLRASLACAQEATLKAEVARDGALAESKQWESAYERARLASAGADYTVDDSELARKIMVFLGRATSGSMEPGADPLRDRLAERLALWRPAAGTHSQPWAAWGVAQRDDLADITDGAGNLIATMYAKYARAVVAAHNETLAALARTTNKGNGNGN